MPASRPNLRAALALALTAILLAAPWPLPARADAALPRIVFVARSRLASGDTLFPRDRGPAGHLTAGLSRFAPGSKLLIREPDGTLRVLVDTSRPPGDPLNPLGLRDLQSPDVSFDARRVVFSGTLGPQILPEGGGPRLSWRLFEVGADGTGLRQLTFSDRAATIPPGSGNAPFYAAYDDLFPAYLADGRVVFSSSRYPARAHYDGRPAFNLYIVAPDGSDMRRITTERAAALHPAALPDGRIVFSRWWVNFNQPSETGVYSRIDNGSGSEVARDQQGRPVTVAREVEAPAVQAPQGAPAQPAQPPGPTPKPTIWPTARPPEQRLTPRPATATPPPTARPAATPAPAQAAPRTTTVRVPVTGYRLPDGTLVYANTQRTFNPARGRLADGFPIRDAPNTWHLMSVTADGGDMRRFAWTPRYADRLTDDSGLDTFNAAQPAVFFSNGELLVAYTTQRDQTMAHSTLYTGVRVARPGVERMAENTTESIAGMRWSAPQQPPYALSPAGLPDGRVLLSQSAAAADPPSSGSYRFEQGGRTHTIQLQRTALRYELRAVAPDGSASAPVPLADDIGDADAVDAVPLVPRPVGEGPGMWRLPALASGPAPSDDPARWNVPRGLLTGDGRPAFPWSRLGIGDVELVPVINENVYANPPLGAPFLNNSPPPGSVAFADIYIDAPQFSGVYRSEHPDDQVRAVKWLTVPVDERGRFVGSVPADVPMFIVLRDKDGRLVRGGSRFGLGIAQGNSPGRAGTTMRCVGCHLGHSSGPLDGDRAAAFGWTNIAPAARATASSGDPHLLNDRRGFVPGVGGYHDRTAPWVASRGAGEQFELRWDTPMAVLDVRLTGAEPGQSGLSERYRVAGELRLYLAGAEVARRQVVPVAPIGEGGTMVRLERPVAADRLVFVVTEVGGTQRGREVAALSEVEVIGQGASPATLAARPAAVALPLVGR